MSGLPRYRLLTDAEIELWRKVAQTVEPRPGSRLPHPAQPEVKAAARPEPTIKAGSHPVHRSMVPSYQPPQSKPRSTVPGLAPLEPRYRKKVARGHIGIERAIDLHGLNQGEAHAALRGFLRVASADQVRLVLVVTGKGNRTPDPTREAGILRRAVPHWLREADLRTVVLGFEEAGQPHGGAGALYVRLRTRRPRP